MGSKEFFKPTILKIIISLVSLLIVYFPLGLLQWNRGNCFLKIGSPVWQCLIISNLIAIILVYLFSCLISLIYEKVR